MAIPLIPIVSALISAAASFGSTVVTNKSNKKIAQQTAEQNLQNQLEINKQQNEFNVEQRDYNNEYNLPANQVQRIKDAGLSPAMVMSGQGVTDATPISASSSPLSQPSAPYATPPDISFLNDTASTIVDALLKQQQIKLDERRVKKEEDLAMSQIDVNTSVIGLNEKEGELKDESKRELQQRIMESQKRAAEIDEKINLLKENIRTEISQQKYYQKMGESAMMNAATMRYEATTKRMIAKAEVQLMKSQEHVNESQVAINRETANKLVYDTFQSYQHTVMNNTEIQWKDKMYSVEYEIKNGQARIVRIDGEIKDKTQYAEIGSAWLNTFNNASQCVENVLTLPQKVNPFTNGSAARAFSTFGKFNSIAQ